MTMPAYALGSIALVLPGEAMWGAFQTGFAIEFGRRLEETGQGTQPFSLAIGSSSGSLVATVAAAGGPFDHTRIRGAWLDFGRATRLNTRSFNPYPGALKEIFENGLVDTDRAFGSATQLIVTAAHYNRGGISHLGATGALVLTSGLSLLAAGHSGHSADLLAERSIQLLETGAHLFAPRYFTTNSRPSAQRPALLEAEEEWIVVHDPAGLRRAVEASSRIPFLYGEPIPHGANLLIDGVFANNAPLELALALGARHVFVVTSSKKGHVFDRPVQSMVRRQLRSLLAQMKRMGEMMNPLPRGRRFRSALKEIAELEQLIPPTRPLDLDDLRRRYPKQKIHIVHPKDPPPVNRFFETRPAVLGRLYDLGVQEADGAFRQVGLQ